MPCKAPWNPPSLVRGWLVVAGLLGLGVSLLTEIVILSALLDDERTRVLFRIAYFVFLFSPFAFAIHRSCLVLPVAEASIQRVLDEFSMAQKGVNFHLLPGPGALTQLNERPGKYGGYFITIDYELEIFVDEEGSYHLTSDDGFVG